MSALQKMMQDLMKGLGSEEAGGAEGDSSSMANDPFMMACSQMFKEFDKVSKENGETPADGAKKDGEDQILMNFINTFAKDILSKEGGEGAGGMDMDSLMNEFQTFLKESGDSGDVKSALDSVVSELLNKDTLYEPMKTLRDEFPLWLEENWQKVSQQELES